MPKADNTHTPIRSSVLTEAPSAADTAIMPPAGHEQITADQELVHLCAQHLINRHALETCPLEADESLHWAPYAATSDAIAKVRPMTLTGLAAKARAAKREALVQDGEEDPRNGSALEWAWDLVNDLIRLDGGMV